MDLHSIAYVGIGLDGMGRHNVRNVLIITGGEYG